MTDTIPLPRVLEDADTIPLPTLFVDVSSAPAPLPPSSRPHHRECARTDREHRGSCFDLMGRKRDAW